MRRIIALSLMLSLAACMARQPEAPVASPSPVRPQPMEQHSLSGLTAQDLVGMFGAPTLQIREGNSLKVQFRGRRCVLDAYLYPSGGSGALKVTHVDTRSPTGSDYEEVACALSLRDRSS